MDLLNASNIARQLHETLFVKLGEGTYASVKVENHTLVLDFTVPQYLTIRSQETSLTPEAALRSAKAI